jgi:hypothetical protein
MGRYDALTQIEDIKVKKSAKKLNTDAITNDLKGSAFFLPNNQSPTPLLEKPETVTSVKTNNREKKPEIMNSRIHETVAPSEGLKEKPQKYSTLLYGHSIKSIKLYSAEKEIKDYEVIELALSAFFEKNK